MRNNGGYYFGPRSRRQVSKNKKPTKLMKKSRNQLKKTQEHYTSMAIRYNNDNEQGDEDEVVSKSDRENKVVPRKTQQNPLKVPSHVTAVPRTDNLTHCSILNNGMTSSIQNTEKSTPCLPRILQKNTEMSRSSSSNNCAISSGKTTKYSSNPNSVMVCSQNDIKKSRPSSSRPNNGRDSQQKNTNGGPLPLNNIEKLKPSSSRLNKGEASLSKNIEMPRSSSFRLNSDEVSLGANFKNSGLSEDGGTDRDKFKSTRMKPLWEKKLETHSEVEICRSKKKRRRFIVHGDGEGDDGAQNVAGAKKGISRFTNSMNCSIQPKDQDTSLADKVMKRKDPSSGENPETREEDYSEETENYRLTKRRRFILNEYEDEDDGDQILAGTEIGTAGLTAQTVVVKDSPIGASNPVLSESLKLQDYGSLPIDEPVWSGTIKISSNRNVSLAAHLSSKCCEQVWKLARSLQPKIVATRLSRLEAWPKRFETSSPTHNDIALYFLPCKMRQDADLDQLVKEVVGDDIVLQAVIGEAEMLIFPSILLPEQHQTFQGKPYLWAVFKRRNNKVAAVVAQQQREGLEAPEEVERKSMEHQQSPSLARANAPSPSTTMDASHGQMHSSLAVPTGALFGFVARRTPRLEQLIKEMEREGSVVVAMEREVIGSCLGQVTDATAADREEDEMPPSSSGHVAMV